MPIISEAKKNAAAPINIAVGTEPAAKVPTTKANILVIIEPTAIPGKLEHSKHSQLRLFPHNTFSNIVINTREPNIKVIITKVRIEVISPAKNTAATPAPTSKLAIILKIQEQILFFSLYINIPPLIYNMNQNKNVCEFCRHM